MANKWLTLLLRFYVRIHYFVKFVYRARYSSLPFHIGSSLRMVRTNELNEANEAFDPSMRFGCNDFNDIDGLR